MRAVAAPMADPQLEFHWIPDPGFLIQGFLIQCLHRSLQGMADSGAQARRCSVSDPISAGARVCYGGGIG